jgi:hypothetical protein
MKVDYEQLGTKLQTIQLVLKHWVGY